MLHVIPHNKPTLGHLEESAASSVIRSSFLSQGSEVENFESDLCNYFNLPRGHALVVSSGSAALFMALWVLDGRGKRVGLPVYSCAALRNAVSLIGGRPVYFDCAEDSPNLCSEQVSKSSVDILIAPSMFGIPVGLPSDLECEVVEDIAQSFGAIANGDKVGLRGRLRICSFYATKLFTSGGQGGALISKERALIDKLRDYRNFDLRNDKKIRFNFQMTDIQAAIGRVQLQRVPDFILKREEWFSTYQKTGVKLVNDSQKGNIPVRYRIVLRCQSPMSVIEVLGANGVKAIVPIEEFELLDEPSLYPNALQLSRTSISLPAYPSLSSRDVRRIAEIVERFA